MTRNVFGWNYPPGAENDPNAPWNEKPELRCFSCGIKLDLEDMSDNEHKSLEDNGDVSFLCDGCANHE